MTFVPEYDSGDYQHISVLSKFANISRIDSRIPCLQIADSIGLPTDEGLFGFKPFPEVCFDDRHNLRHVLCWYWMRIGIPRTATTESFLFLMAVLHGLITCDAKLSFTRLTCDRLCLHRCGLAAWQ